MDGTSRPRADVRRALAASVQRMMIFPKEMRVLKGKPSVVVLPNGSTALAECWRCLEPLVDHDLMKTTRCCSDREGCEERATHPVTYADDRLVFDRHGDVWVSRDPKRWGWCFGGCGRQGHLGSICIDCQRTKPFLKEMSDNIKIEAMIREKVAKAKRRTSASKRPTRLFVLVEATTPQSVLDVLRKEGYRVEPTKTDGLLKMSW